MLSIRHLASVRRPTTRWAVRYYASSVNDRLKGVNTCHLRLHISAKDKSDKPDDKPEDTDEDESYTAPADAKPVSYSSVDDAIKKFVERGTVAPAKKPEGKSDSLDPHRYDVLATRLSRGQTVRDGQVSVIPERFIVGAAQTPYERLLVSKGEDLSHRKNDARLSVTKILPYNWCELKDMFGVYGGMFERVKTKAMARGQAEHAQFEVETHPQRQIRLENGNDVTIEETQAFAELPEVNVSQIYESIGQLDEKVDPALKDLAENWNRTILRLLNLFQFGECREVLVHSMYDIEDNVLLGEKAGSFKTPSDYIIISGIIDHLEMESGREEGVFEGYQQELRDSLDDYLDISELVSRILQKAEHWCDRDDPFLYVVVKDLKTRSGKSLPHPAQQKSAKSQVGMYRKFLDLLGQDSKLTYESLLANAIKRGVDPYVPLPQSVVSKLMLQNFYMIKDLVSLKNGTEIGFDPYDSSPYAAEFALSLPSIPEELKGTWERSPTLELLAARLAQLYECLYPFLSNDNYVEYSCKGEVFRQIHHIYNEEVTNSDIQDGLALWMGAREPRTPFFRNICNGCDYKLQCGWNLRTNTS